MKRSRLRRVAACVRTVRRLVDVDDKRRRKQLNRDETCDVIKSKGNITSMAGQGRYRHNICRDDDVTGESELEMTSLYADSIAGSSCHNVELMPVDDDDVRLISDARESYPSGSDCSSGSSLSLDWLCDDSISVERRSRGNMKLYTL